MLNKTPKKQPDETESALKSNRYNYKKLLLIVLIVSLAISIIYALAQSQQNVGSELTAPNGSIQIEIADTPESRQQGLSGKKYISGDYGMLFVFDRSTNTNCFWMKDMQFSIDMVWLDEDKNVVTVTPSVGPNTFPESFCPTKSAKYGLEIRAARAAELGIVPDVELGF